MPLRDHNPSHGKEYLSSQADQFGTVSASHQTSQGVGYRGPSSREVVRKPVPTQSTRAEDHYQAYAHTPGNNGSPAFEPSINTSPVRPELSGPSVNISRDQNPPAQYHTPRGSHTYGRKPEELHLSPKTSTMGDMHRYQGPPIYGGGESLSINVQPSTPQHPNSAAGNPMPGALQPGSMGRPGPLSNNSAPGSIPTLPQISTQLQHGPHSSRPVTMNQSHSYSRSSPTSLEQVKYKAFTHTPESAKYDSSGRIPIPQTPQSSSYSPLGLADIRPRADTGLSDDMTSPGYYSGGVTQQYPTNSNYVAPWPIYASDWCKWPSRTQESHAGKIAIGSYLEDNHNYIQILDTQRAQPDPADPHNEPGLEFIKTAEATHSYPVTRILWEPPSSNKQTTDLLATSGDHLRLWSLPNDPQVNQSNSINRSSAKEQTLQKLSPLALLSNSKSPEHTAPITSLDWNVVSPSLIITSSIDTTCTIWDIPTLTAKTQLIAHDKEVFDVRFCAQSVDVFVSCGADGSVRMFDLRSLEHSTIIYEPSDKNDKNAIGSPGNMSPTTAQQTMSFPPPLLRIAASPHDAHLLATFSQDSKVIRVLDVRQPGQALLELKGHSAAVNCIDWSPNHRGFLASGADDSLVLVWDLMSHAGAATPQPGGPTNTERGPSASWQCDFEVSNISWAPTNGTLGVCGGRGFWGVQM